MTLQEAEAMIAKYFPDDKLKVIDDLEKYFVFELDGPPSAFDRVHMIEKSTGKMQPYDPTLL